MATPHPTFQKRIDFIGSDLIGLGPTILVLMASKRRGHDRWERRKPWERTRGSQRDSAGRCWTSFCLSPYSWYLEGCLVHGQCSAHKYWLSKYLTMNQFTCKSLVHTECCALWGRMEDYRIMCVKPVAECLAHVNSINIGKTGSAAMVSVKKEE